MGTQKNTLIFQKEAYHEIRVVKSLWFHNNFHIQFYFSFGSLATYIDRLDKPGYIDKLLGFKN